MESTTKAAERLTAERWEDSELYKWLRKQKKKGKSPIFRENHNEIAIRAGESDPAFNFGTEGKKDER